MDIVRPLILLISTPTTLQNPPTPIDKWLCQPGYAPSQQEISYPAPPCEPCTEHGVAYHGNNVNLTPDYGVKNVEQCRNLCREEIRCHYFTFDQVNLWCFLKSKKSSRGTKEGASSRYISGSENILCQSDDENEIEVDTKVSEPDTTEDSSETTEEENRSRKQSSSELPTPILSVYHENGYRTVLTAIPSTFGLLIQNDTEISGHLVQIEDFMCNLPNNHLTHNSADGNQFAVIRRGVCKFAEKVETAVKAGFEGVVILDDQNNTDVKRISGQKTSLTENVPVVFLLRKEAAILKRLLAESPNITATIQESNNFSWFRRKPSPRTTTKPAQTTLQRLQHKKFLLGMRDPGMREPWPPWWPSRKQPKQFHAQSQSSRQNINSTSSSTLVEVSTEPISPRGVLEMTPLTMGSIIVGVLFFVLLLTSVGTLIVSKYTKRARRRANHTRCQLAIRQMEANGSLSQDNAGFSADSSSSAPPQRALPKSTYSLLECPVCLELAWPPKRIYQCREGHIVCDVCKANPNLRNCPMCRIPFATNFTSRNRQLEELARTLKEEDQLERIAAESSSTMVPSAPEFSEVLVESGDTSELILPENRAQIVITQAFISPEVSSAPTLPDLEVGEGSAGPLVVTLPPEVD